MTVHTSFCNLLRKFSRLLVLGSFFLCVAVFAQQAVKYDAATISGLPARNIGSATMSGRIAAVTAVKENGRLTVYVGAASGGVWKSGNGGTTFTPMLDHQPGQSIGAMPRHP